MKNKTITTETLKKFSCQDLLARKFITSRFDWKKIRKYNGDGFIGREFLNKKTGIKITIKEKNGEIFINEK